MTRLLLLAALFVPATAIACTALGDDESASQGAAHRERQPTFGSHDWLWANESLDEFKNNAAQNIFGGGADLFPQDHPMVQRLQLWVDAMDAVLRQTHPDQLKAVPKPVMILTRSGFPNAWVTRLPVGWDLPIRLDPNSGAPDAGDPDAGDIEESQLALGSEGRLRPILKAYSRPFDDTRVRELVDFANHGFARCRLGFQDGSLTFNAACRSDQDRVARGKAFAYYATARHVTVTPAYIVGLGTEDRVIASLAHELGHYYRSHANMPSDVMNYFYSLEGEHHADKPSPDPRYLEQTQQVREKLRSNAWDYSKENTFMAEHKVGFYTVEQEADELGIELGARVGISPSTAIDEMLALQKYLEEMFAGFGATGVPWAECAELRARDFKDEAGTVISVQVGDLQDPHHSWCFRAFNAQREIEAHHYQLGPRPKVDGASWDELVATVLKEAVIPALPPTPKADAGL